MELDVQIIQGPHTAKVSKAVAEEQLTKHPAFPKGATYRLEELEGRWIAAISAVKEAAPPAFAEGGGDTDSPPTSDGPPGPPTDDGTAEDVSEAEEPKGEDGEDKKGEDGKEPKGEGAELKQVLHMLTTLMDALGLSPQGPEDSPVPGPDGAVPPPPGAPGEPAPGQDGKTHTVHERALKPGEAPPGTTPVGSPSFASTHPWADVLGKKRSFTVQEEIGSQDISTVAHELSALCSGTGYEVKQLREGTADGNKRVARAIIAKAA
jgi:hypothetical protein